MPRRNNRAPHVSVNIKKSFTGSTECERVVLFKRGDEYKTVVISGTRDSVMEEAFYIGTGLVPGQTWTAVDQHAYHGPEDEAVDSFNVKG